MPDQIPTVLINIFYVNKIVKIMADKKENNIPPIPDKSLIMAKATTVALGIVLVTLIVVFIILTLIK